MLDQFNYDFNAALENDRLVVRTDETDISALLKFMIDKGARVEVYSAHDHPTPSERGSD